MKSFIYSLSAILLFSFCNKKTADTVSVKQTSDPAKAWRKSPPQPGAARDIQLGTYNSFDLDNGLKVIVVENHKLPRVSYQLSLNTDALIEGDKAGYVSFAGDMLSKGTTKRSKADIDNAVDFIGASLNTSGTGVFGSTLKKHSETLLEIMTDVLYNPTFPQEEFDKIRKRTLSGLATAKSDPNSIASNIGSIVNYGYGHPYGEVQTEQTVNNINIDDCKNYYNTYFKPNNAYLVIVGDITPEEAKAQATKYFAKWKKGDVPTFKYPVPAAPKERKVAFGNKDGAVQSVINITYPVEMKPGNPDAIKASLMNSILGGGIFSGRLMQNLREKKAYTYGARSNISNDKLIGNFNATASVRNEVTDSSVQEFLFEMDRIVNEPVSSEDLFLAKNSLAGNFARSLESPQTIANFALNTFRYNLPKDYYNTYLQKLDVVSVDDVQMMAKKYVRPENCNIIVVGNKDNVADKLLRFDSDGKIEFYDPFGKLIEDKKIEIDASVTPKSVIEDYLEAIGGVNKLKTVQNIVTAMKASLMGQEATFETIQAAPDKFSLKVMMMGMTVQEQKFNGQKAMTGQMGQNQVYTEGEEFEALKGQAKLFEQFDYLTDEYTLELKGIEDVDGTDCYKILITDKKGEVKTEYFAVKSNLLARSVVTQQAQGQTVSITNDFKDYKLVGGVLIPHTITLSGAMPVPIVMEATKIEVNTTLAADTFNID
ncbi:MAG: insulinase family protein [Saprospiraceae bacterium]|nr:insulinase family protein [Saprospiraceae bacterium]